MLLADELEQRRSCRAGRDDLRGLKTRPSSSRTPVTRPLSTSIPTTRASVWMVPPSRSIAPTSASTKVWKPPA